MSYNHATPVEGLLQADDAVIKSLTVLDSTTFAGPPEKSAFQLLTAKDQAGGYAGLDADGNLSATVLIRHDTAANIAALVLADGEIAVTTDTNRMYRGDGATAGGILLTSYRPIQRCIPVVAGGTNTVKDYIPAGLLKPGDAIRFLMGLKFASSADAKGAVVSLAGSGLFTLFPAYNTSSTGLMFVEVLCTMGSASDVFGSIVMDFAGAIVIKTTGWSTEGSPLVALSGRTSLPYPHDQLELDIVTVQGSTGNAAVIYSIVEYLPGVGT